MNPEFEVIGDMIEKLQESTPEQSQFLRETITLKNLLPENLEKLYRYHGSLTTPPCTEGLVWLVLSQPSEIGRSQVCVENKKKKERERKIIHKFV